MLRRLPLLLALLVAGLVVPLGAVTSPAEAACKPRITSLTAAKKSFVSGGSTTMTVLLSCAPRTKRTVNVKVDHRPTFYTSTGYVTVKARQRKATFTLFTSVRPNTVRAKVQARLAGTTRWVASTPLVTASASACDPKSVSTPPLVYTGAKATGTLSLTCVLDVPKKVSIEAIPSTGSSSFFHVPASVTVPAKHRSVSFPITFGTSSDVQIATVRVTGSGRILSDIQFYPGLSGTYVDSEITDAGLRHLRIGLGVKYPAPKNFVVRLTSSDPHYQVPSTVTIPEGEYGAQIVTPDVSSPEVDDLSELVSVTATPQGSTQQVTEATTVLRDFRPGDPIMATRSSSVLRQGGTVGLTTQPYPVGPSGLEVTFTSSSPLVHFESPTMTISPGDNNAKTNLLFDPVATTTDVTITVAAGSTTAQTTVRLEPTITSVVIPETAAPGTEFEGVLTLSGVSTSDQTIALLNPTPGLLTAPENVTVPAGVSQVTFTATVADQPTRDQARLRATIGGVSVWSNTITATPDS